MKRLTFAGAALVAALLAFSLRVFASNPQGNMSFPQNILTPAVGVGMSSTPLYGVDIAAGGLHVGALGTPSAPTLTHPSGSTGSTSRTYYVVAVDQFGNETVPSAGSTFSTGPATLTSTNYIRVSIAAMAGAAQYKILKTNTSTLVATVTAATYPAATVYLDANAITSAYTPQTSDQTGPLTLSGNLSTTVNNILQTQTSAMSLLNTTAAVTNSTAASVTGSAGQVWPQPPSIDIPAKDPGQQYSPGLTWTGRRYNGTTSEAVSWEAQLQSVGSASSAAAASQPQLAFYDTVPGVNSGTATKRLWFQSQTDPNSGYIETAIKGPYEGLALFAGVEGLVLRSRPDNAFVITSGSYALAALDSSGWNPKYDGTYDLGYGPFGYVQTWRHVYAKAYSNNFTWTTNTPTPTHALEIGGGQIAVTQLSTPATPTLSILGGAAGAYTYKCVAKDKFSNASLPSTVSTAVGPTTLDNTHSITVGCVMTDNTYSIDVLRTAGGSTQGLIGNVSPLVIAGQSNLGTAVSVVDTGLAATGYTTPTRNTTSDVSLGGQVTISEPSTNAAASGSQVVSPDLIQCGNGWQTTSPASESVCWKTEVQPVQAATHPTGKWVLYSSVNGAAYAEQMEVQQIASSTTVIGTPASTNFKVCGAAPSGASCANFQGGANEIDFSFGGTNAYTMLSSDFRPDAVGKNLGATGGAQWGTAFLSRTSVSGGTALSSGDIALSGGWGASATVGTISGTDAAFKFTVSTAGAGIGANPTITVTYKNGTWTTAPICLVDQSTTSDVTALTDKITYTGTATALTVTFNGTPLTANTYVFNGHCIGVN